MLKTNEKTMTLSLNITFTHYFFTFILLSCLSCTTNRIHSNYTVKRPNIVLIFVDDMGYSDLGCFGSEIKTPHLDSLAANGIRFTNFHNCAKCETTRATLISGRFHPEVNTTQLNNCMTIAEGMKAGGYHTIMSGKWHLTGNPIDHGFDRYFGFLNGAVNFFTGESTLGGKKFRLDKKEFVVPDKEFYTTDAFTDYAIKFLNEREKDKPFFLYLAHNAPHYPLHAHKKDVDKYRGTYRMGWNVLRDQRLKRMKEQGIISKDQKLSATPADHKKFSDLSAEQQDHEDLMMATYAAMIDCVDQNIGRFVNHLKKIDVFDNTLIFFLSDNGACPFQRSTPDTIKNNLKPWDPKSFWTYDKHWAHACNTPLRKYKQNQHEGGTRTSMIAHWPQGIVQPGRIDRQLGHVVDFHATCLDLAGVPYPTTYKTQNIGPQRGLSLDPILKGKQRIPHKELFYTFKSKYSALQTGDWKLVDNKELYNIKDDIIEMNNLKDKHPEKFNEMKKRWAELNASFPDNKKKKK